MDVRIVTREEYLAYLLLCNECFLFAADPGYEDWHKNLEEHSKGYEEVLAGFDNQNKLVTGLRNIPYNMYFDGHLVKMGGIAAVVTAPEARAGGAMSKIMAESLRIMKERGQIFSILYPFSYAYYRKFGYEAAYRLNTAEISTEVFCKYPFPKDSVRLWKKGNGAADIKAVYDVFKKGRNYILNRDDEKWEQLTKNDPYTTMRYIYIHYDSQNKPDAYLMMHPGERRPDHSIDLYIDELAWATKSGLSAMFGFIGGLRPQFDKTIWDDVPMELDLYSLFPEAHNISINSRPSAMTRIVDLPKVLEKLRPPNLAQGKVVIDVTDKFFPCNTGNYTLSWQNGELSVAKTGQNPDMSTTIETMAQMVIGYLNPEEAGYRPDTTIYSQHEALMALFPKKTLCLWERF